MDCIFTLMHLKSLKCINYQNRTTSFLNIVTV